MSDYDYEYIPSTPDAPPPLSKTLQLESAYPPGTPAGLRGEAVRSAIRSTRCIAFISTTGWIQVEGKGTIDFCSNKLSQTFGSQTFQEACLLTPKGRIVDQVSVALQSPTKAFLWTSPGHDGIDLYNRLDPLIFPMDQVKLENCECFVFALASVSKNDVKTTVQKHLLPLLKTESPSADFFPADSNSCRFHNLQGDIALAVLPSIHLPECACEGYTFVFQGDVATGQHLFREITGDNNPEGPVAIGPLELETLRIEAGQPAFGKELTASLKETKRTPANPLELPWQQYVDLEKGCYLGQEGIASILKNKRGPARSLYSVVFEDEGNVYSHQTEGDAVPNLTILPEAGNELFVLGSNEQISIGTLTSVAEAGATGDPCIVALALVKRADSILKKMKDLDIEIAHENPQNTPIDNGPSGIIQPPPMDPLDGLEVIVGGTFTVGVLKSIPMRRFFRGQNMFSQDIPNNLELEMEGSVMGVRMSNEMPNNVLDADIEEENLEEAAEEAAKAQAEAEAAAAEAQRKAEKLEMLKRRAEEAMARRKKNKNA